MQFEKVDPKKSLSLSLSLSLYLSLSLSLSYSFLPPSLMFISFSLLISFFSNLFLPFSQAIYQRISINILFDVLDNVIENMVFIACLFLLSSESYSITHLTAGWLNSFLNPFKTTSHVYLSQSSYSRAISLMSYLWLT